MRHSTNTDASRHNALLRRRPWASRPGFLFCRSNVSSSYHTIQPNTRLAPDLPAGVSFGCLKKRTQMKRTRTLTLCTVVLASVASAAIGVSPASADTIKSCEDGSTYYVETLADGGIVQTRLTEFGPMYVIQPPTGFDPLTASAEELDRYGVPTKPTDSTSEEFTNWLALAQVLAGQNSASICDLDSNPSDPQIFNTVFSHNWGGYVAKQSIPAYIGVAAQWVEPAYAAPTAGCATPQASIWVGVGGYKTQSLLQAGTALTASGAHVAWYEWLSPLSSVPMLLFTNSSIRAGDSIYAYVSVSTNLSQVTFNVTNLSTSTYYTQRVTMTPISNFLEGTSAEVIAERITLVAGSTSSLADLANFGTIPFTNAQVQVPDGTYRTLRATVPLQLSIVNASNVALESTSTMPSATSFSTSFLACK